MKGQDTNFCDEWGKQTAVRLSLIQVKGWFCLQILKNKIKLHKLSFFSIFVIDLIFFNWRAIFLWFRSSRLRTGWWRRPWLRFTLAYWSWPWRIGSWMARALAPAFTWTAACRLPTSWSRTRPRLFGTRSTMMRPRSRTRVRPAPSAWPRSGPWSATWMRARAEEEKAKILGSHTKILNTHFTYWHLN